ncbi:coiled-coil domain-containing protein 121-like [Meriones unguiculatus]|uniref:coiled-coil domain-containing protein 121-like n=1 Tax=Meriones unguiculatus TaxID=10047 RepID=UPI000B4ED186|nr:coiled-coil domain-containing protein 121-like [Meriones unguiculatus]
MGSQGQGYHNWETTGRRATIFAQKEGARGSVPAVLPDQQGEKHLLTPLTGLYRPPPARKSAMCDFRVRWPELAPKDQEAQRENQPGLVLSSDWKPYDQSCSCSCSFSSGISLRRQESSHSEPHEAPKLTDYFPEPPEESPHMTIFNTYLKPESMTALEKKVWRKTLVVMNQLEQEKGAIKFQRAVLLREARELQEEHRLEEAEKKPFLEYLKKRHRKTQKTYDSLWKDYIRQSQEIEKKRRELLKSFNSRTANLEKQLMEGKKLDASLKKKLKALRPVEQVKQSQDRNIQDLEDEEFSIVADTPFMDREKHLKFLKDRAALEEQVEELNLLESGEAITRELRKKAKALETMAKQAQKDFCQGMHAENKRLWAQIHQLDQDFSKLEARREKLEQRKQQWKEQHWYLEALARGRQRLQQLERRTLKPQAAPQPIQSRLLGARLKTNPK